MQVAGMKCQLCGQLVALHHEGVGCPRCGVTMHARCNSMGSGCPACGGELVSGAALQASPAMSRLPIEVHARGETRHTNRVGGGRWFSVKHLWPSVRTDDEAIKAVKQASGVALFCAAVFTLFGFLAVTPVGRDIFGVTNLVDAFLFALIAWGIWKQSRLAAWSGLVLCLSEVWRLRTMENYWMLAIILLLTFIAGIRGVHALHSIRGHQSA